MKSKKLLSVVLLVVFGFSIVLTGCGSNNGGGTAEEGPIKIGAIVSLSGAKADIGQDDKRGLDFALKKINESGGVLGRQLELIYEDDKGDPTTCVSAGEKLVNKDNVDAIVGTYGSTEVYALLGALKKYEPIVVLSGAGAPKVEAQFGQEDWFFHLYPWSYYYWSTAADFLDKTEPRPTTIALAYEDTLYGTDHSTYAKKYMEQKGFEIVAYESFKSGATDYTSLITKFKNLNPDVFLFIGYVGDAILLTKQAKELDFNPKMYLDTLGVGQEQYKDALGSSSDNVVGIVPWSPACQYPASEEYSGLLPSTQDWVKEFEEIYGRVPTDRAVMEYVSLVSLAQAIEKAGTTDKEAVKAELNNIKTMTPMGYLEFSESDEGGLLQGFKSMVIFQWQNGEKVVIFPEESANGEILYPTPAWNQR